jgi:F0F1-type ATP synthase assembly protein I
MNPQKKNGFKYLNFALSFGLTLVITLYLLYQGGKWLDKRLGTEPLFMILGILLAVATIFRQLIVETKDMDKE